MSDHDTVLVRPMPSLRTVHVTGSGAPEVPPAGTSSAVTTRSAYGIGITSSGSGAAAVLFASLPFSNTTPCGVGAHEHREAPVERRRREHRLGAAVRIADGHGTGVIEAAEHDVVEVADGGVAREHDRVGPRQRLADAGARVGDRPADGDPGGVVDQVASAR